MDGVAIMRQLFVLVAIAIGSLIGSTAAEAAGVTYAYDGQGRVTQAAYANGTVITYTYDTAGNVTSQQVACPSSGC